MHRTQLAQYVVLLLSTSVITTIAKPLNPRWSSPNPARRLSRRDDSDPQDQSWIKNWAAVGDSYSAGIGAGAKLGGWGDYFCSRYNDSFPNIINNDPRLGNGGGRSFTNWPCSGAKTDDVIKQANALKGGSQDVITITSGGNDAKLSDILNECVYGWNAHSTPTYDACPPVLKDAQKIIDSDDFHKKLDKLISTAKSKLKSGGTIYYAGYAQFFGEGSKQCDKVTWSFWVNYGKREYLTLDHRKTMNQLVRNMNSAIQDAVKRAASDQVVFVDYDKYYQSSVGRFCEDGHPETDSNREGLVIYNYYTDDKVEPGAKTADNTKLARSGGLVMNGTFEGQINAWVQEAAAADSSLKPAQPEEDVAGDAPSIKDVKATEDQIVTGYSSYLLPDSYGRIFHPRPAGHALIANLILYEMEVTKAKKINKSVPTESAEFDQCPAGTSSTPKPKGKPCEGNQVTTDNCVQATFPSNLKPESGPQQPICMKYDGKSVLRINEDEAKKGVSEYCNNLIEGKVKLDKSYTSPKPGIISGGAENNGDIAISVAFWDVACDKGKSSIDFGSMSLQECYDNFYTTIDQFCAQDSTWGKEFNPDAQLEGGLWGNQCGMWSLAGQPGS